MAQVFRFHNVAHARSTKSSIMPNPLDEPEDPTPSLTPKPDDRNDAVPAVDGGSHAPLAIEAPKSADQAGQAASETAEEPVHVLDVGEGNVVKLDKLGPIIVNSDGTLSRIPNWQDLHPIEQERTVRLLIKKRNMLRLEKLRKEDEQPTSDS